MASSSSLSVPSDLYPYIYGFLRDSSCVKTAKTFRKETQLVVPGITEGPSLLEIFDEYKKSLSVKKLSTEPKDSPRGKKRKIKEDDEVPTSTTKVPKKSTKAGTPVKDPQVDKKVEKLKTKKTKLKQPSPSVDSDSEMEVEKVPVMKKKKGNKPIFKKEETSSSEEEEAKATDGDEESSSEEEEKLPVEIKKKSKGISKEEVKTVSPLQPMLSIMKCKAKQSKAKDSVLVKPVSKSKAAAPQESSSSSEEDSEEEEETVKPENKASKQESSSSNDEEKEEEETDESVAKDSKSSQEDSSLSADDKTKKKEEQKKPVKPQDEESSSDSEEESDEESEDKTKPTPPTSQSSKISRVVKAVEKGSSNDSSSSSSSADESDQEETKKDVKKGKKAVQFTSASPSTTTPLSSSAKKEKKKKEQQAEASKPFRRISDTIKVDSRLSNNSFEAKKGSKGSWGEKANKDLKHTKGKSFRHEKTKKKRGTYRGGVIDTQVNSIKFDSD